MTYNKTSESLKSIGQSYGSLEQKKRNLPTFRLAQNTKYFYISSKKSSRDTFFAKNSFIYVTILLIHSLVRLQVINISYINENRSFSENDESSNVFNPRNV